MAFTLGYASSMAQDGFTVMPADSVITDSLTADSISNDTTSGFGRVFKAIDRLFESNEKWTRILTDSLTEVEGKEFDELSRRKQKRLIKQVLGDQWAEWNNTDSMWIMPQLYNYAVMLQSTTTFENFTIRSLGEEQQSLRFAPEPSFRLGGYFGWRWLFLGYNWDISGLLGNKTGVRKNKSLDLSIYTSKVGIDLYYRDTGNDFECTNLNDLFSEERPRPEGITDEFDAIRLKTKGLNVYYIFNHRHYSHPAAFSQTTCQLRSCGTFKLGLSFTHHKVSLDNSKLDERLTPFLDPTLFFNTVKYNDYSINFGYAYNWVFARNWLFCADLAPGLAYNVTYYDAYNIESGSVKEEDTVFRHFSLNKLNFDFITRMAIVYNNTRYFAGMSFQFHSFDYRNRQVSMNNSFGYLRFYIGMNFGRKR